MAAPLLRQVAPSAWLIGDKGYDADHLRVLLESRGTTVALSRARVGEDWVADHTHMSLFRDVPSRSFGEHKPG